MAARWLSHTLYLRARRAAAGGQVAAEPEDYSVKDLVRLAWSTQQGWVEAVPEGLRILDVLPLSWKATDWLMGAWGAMRDEEGYAGRVELLDEMLCGVELGHLELDELQAVRGAMAGAGERVLLQDVLVALKQAALMEDSIADSQPYLEQQQVGGG